MRWVILLAALLAAALWPAGGHVADGAIRYGTYTSYVERMQKLAREYPELVELATAQERFGLPSVGKCGGGDCLIYILTLTNRTSFRTADSRPEVLVSGEVHGNERIGPAAVIAFAEFVVRERSKNPWLDFLLNNRVVTLIPMTNAVGYEMNKREEIQVRNASTSLLHVKAHRRKGDGETVYIDPNRDFPFNKDPKKCMRTVAARALNELFRTRIFTLLLTFHSGVNVLGYEWGDYSHCDRNHCTPAPDAALMRVFAKRLSRYAGPAGTFEKPYPTGTMGRLVYPVHGGMEDWAYGASWSDAVVQCRPRTLNGYPLSKMKYTFESNRCVTFLVETSRFKEPPEDTLGTIQGIRDLVTGGEGDGHVPRNVRLMLATVDMVEPYVSIMGSAYNSSSGKIHISWRVGGAFHADGTHLQFGSLKGQPNGFHGFGRTFAGRSSLPVASKGEFGADEFMQEVRSAKGPVFVRAAAVVDRALTGHVGNTRWGRKPVSHFANIRNDPNWAFSSAQSKIKGRAVWYSDVYRVVLLSNTSKMEIERQLVWNRDIRGDSEKDIMRALLDTKSDGREVFKTFTGSFESSETFRNAVFSIPGIVVLGVIALAIGASLVFWKRRRSALGAHRDGVRGDEDQGVTTPLFEIGSDDEGA